MEIILHTRNVAWAQALCNHVTRRFRQELEGLEAELARVSVIVSFEPDTQGGAYNCIATVRTHAKTMLRACDRQANLFLAVDRAAARARLALWRTRRNSALGAVPELHQINISKTAARAGSAGPTHQV
jgi:ribosome-associated translation inhibitor RaiA